MDASDAAVPSSEQTLIITKAISKCRKHGECKDFYERKRVAIWAPRGICGARNASTLRFTSTASTLAEKKPVKAMEECTLQFIPWNLHHKKFLVLP